MAIRSEKYVDVTAGVGGAASVGRRELIGRVFTMNPLCAEGGRSEFNDADEVMRFFGVHSPEYAFAAKYFGFVSKSITSADRISFVPWNWRNLDRRWTNYTVTARQHGVVSTDENGVVAHYPDIVTFFARLPECSIVRVTLEEDIVFVSSATKADARRGFSDAEATDDDALLHGIVIGECHAVELDLNGHDVSFDIHCFTNHGFLRINDSVGTGCVYTTNFADTVDGVKHTDASWSKGSCETVFVRDGVVEINGGWFGTDEPSDAPRVNDVNWGLCIGVEGGLCTVNGGHFTTVTNQVKTGKNGIANRLQDWIDANVPGAKRSWLCDAEFPNAGKGPWGFIAETHYDGRLVVNGGEFFGAANGILGCVGDHGETTAELYGSVTVNGGEFRIGFPKHTLDFALSTQCFCYAGTNGDTLTEWAVQVGERNAGRTHTCQSNTLPSYLNGTQYKVATVSGGVVTKFTVYDTYARCYVNGGRFSVGAEFVKLPFSGRVSFRGADSTDGFEIPDEFSRLEIEDDGIRRRKEKPVEAFVRSDGQSENFGSFCFLDNLTDAEIGEVARHNATKNFKYLYSVSAKPSRVREVLKSVGGSQGTCLTLDRFAAHAEFMPMALLAATRYDRTNATKCFMFQQFDGENPSVTSTEDADTYDSFDADGRGTRYCVNYYGNTHRSGSTVAFYQDGYNVEGTDTAVYCNEMWMKDAIGVELINLFMAMEKIPDGPVGAAMCRSVVSEVVGEALRNGTVLQMKELTPVQRVYVDRTSGVEGAWESVVNNGYWLSAEVKRRVSGGRTIPYVDYVLLYAKGDSVRKITGSDIML